MATPIEEAREALDGAHPRDVQVNHLTDGSIQIIIAANDKPEVLNQSKWAQIADQLAAENFLRDGLGDQLRQHARQFRDNILLKAPFDKLE